MAAGKADLLRGTLDMLILKTLSLQPLHGFGISRRIDQLTDGVFQIQSGSLFPALKRLEQEASQVLPADGSGRAAPGRGEEELDAPRAGDHESPGGHLRGSHADIHALH
jgi:hypothetical protein